MAVLVGEDGIRQVEAAAVPAQVARPGEGHQGHGCVTEVIEAVAHGDGVVLARQSGQVTVEDEHRRPSVLVRQAPPISPVVGQVDPGCGLADERGHARR